MSAADFNGDGNMDVAIAVGDKNQVYIVPGGGGGSFGEHQAFTTGDHSTAYSTGQPDHLIVDDLNEDGAPDLLAVNWEGSVSVLLSR